MGGQWASNGEMTPSATLTWDEEVILTSIELADRNLPENVVAGTLTWDTPVRLTSIATVTVSSSFGPGFGPEGLTDGPGGQWASQGEQMPWAEFSWPDTFVQLSGVSLQDRPGPEESIANGTLSFSDGTTIAVGPLPDDGAPLEVSFPEKVTQSVRFTADGGVGANVGLLEFGLTALLR